MPSTAATFYPATTKATQTPANPAGVYDLVTTTPTGAANATTTLTWTTTTQAYEQVKPFTANSTTGTLPATNAAASGQGWRMLQTDVGSTSTAERIVDAGTWNFNLYYSVAAPALLATITMTFTVIVYVIDSSGNSTEAFRATAAGKTATAAATQAVAITASASQVTIPAGGSLQTEWWIQSAATANTLNQITNTVITFEVGGTTTPTSVGLATPGLRTLYLQSSSDPTTQSDADTRQVVHPRSESDTTTLSDADARVLVASRADSDTTTLSEADTRVALFPRTNSDTTSLSDADVRLFLAVRADSDTTTLLDQGATRSLIYRRLETDTYTESDVDARVINYGRFDYDNIGTSPQDYHGISYGKTISGYVYDPQGNPLAGVTVYLIREADNAMVATTVSDSTGYYSFSRYTSDPYTYHVTAEDTISNTQYHGTSDWGLVGA